MLRVSTAGTLTTHSRIEAIDALRGLFMCVIILSHAISGLHGGELALPARLAFDPILRLGGTPGFCMISGAMLGYFIVIRPNRFAIGQSYRRRSLQLILMHPLIALALFGPLGDRMPFGEFLVRRWYITDNLAVFFALGPWLLPRLAPRTRLLIGAALLLLSKLFHVLLAPQSTAGMLLYEVFLGFDPLRHHILMGDYGLAPTAAYFLIGSFIGDRFAVALRTGTIAWHLRELTAMTLPLLALSVLLTAVWGALKVDLIGSGNDIMQQLLYPGRSLTLFPAYLAGFLAALVVLVRRTWPHGTRTALERALIIFGRTSLFTYIAQYVIVQTLPWALGWAHRMSLLQMALFLTLAYPLLLALAKAYLWWLQRRRMLRERPAPAPAT